ncbi:MAG: FAD-binding oxidoreductase, partial [Gammaproteobacteria bacterium]|nr:FAD-binding oxidoreductase [Gammaproteobacteria bacterium]
TFGEEAAKAYYRTQVDAVELVREIAAAESIDVQMQGDGELDTAHTQKSHERQKLEHEALTRVLGIDAELFGPDEFRERFYDSAEQYGGMLVRPTFGLHPLRYCRGLAAAAARHGARLHDRSEVIEWKKGNGGFHHLTTRDGTLRARKVVYATNGFISEDLRPEFRGYTLPIISAIIATRPLSEEERAAHHWRTELPAANTRRILNYYRMLPDGRFLLGGRGHGRGEPRGEQQTFSELQRTLGKIWPHWRDIEIEYKWLGLICFTGSLRSVIGQTDDDASVFYGYGYHGNGVANGTWTGKKLAQWIGSGSPPELPNLIQGLGKKFPMPKLRFNYLQLGIALSGWLDKRGS